MLFYKNMKTRKSKVDKKETLPIGKDKKLANEIKPDQKEFKKQN